MRVKESIRFTRKGDIWHGGRFVGWIERFDDCTPDPWRLCFTDRSGPVRNSVPLHGIEGWYPRQRDAKARAIELLSAAP